MDETAPTAARRTYSDRSKLAWDRWIGLGKNTRKRRAAYERELDRLQADYEAAIAKAKGG